MVAIRILLILPILLCNNALSLSVGFEDVAEALPSNIEDDIQKTMENDRSLATAVVNTHVLTNFNYKGSQVYVYGALSNENENILKPQKWLFYFIPIMLPTVEDDSSDRWIYAVNDEVRVSLALGNDDVEQLARQAIVRKYDLSISQYSKFWDVAPLMIDSLMAYIVRGTGSPVEGVLPYKAVHPNQLVMEFRFYCSSTNNAEQIMSKITDSTYLIEVSFYFAGFKQVTTNMISITSDQLKSVLSKTVADGGNKNPQYIHRNQGSSFVSKYMTNVKRMIYLEDSNANVSFLTAGLEDQFTSLFQQGVTSSEEVKIDSKLYDQVWSSNDLHPDRITSELQKLFTYNQTATQRHNYSDNYFDFNQAYAQSSTASGGGGFGIPGIFSISGSGGSSSSSNGHLLTTTQTIVSQTDIQNLLAQESVETAWTGDKFIPKSFYVHKLLDITDRLQIAIIAKQIIAEKTNGAIVRMVNTRNFIQSAAENMYSRPIVGEIKMFSGNASSLPRGWLPCYGQRLSRIEYQSLFGILGVRYGVGDGATTFQLPDFQNRFPLGFDSNDVQQANQVRGGSSTQTLTMNQIPSHSHSSGSLYSVTSGSHTHRINDPGHNHGGRTDVQRGGAGDYNLKSNGRGPFDDGKTHTHSIPTGYTYISVAADGSHSHSVSGSTGSSGAGQPFSIIPPYQMIEYIIYAGSH